MVNSRFRSGTPPRPGMVGRSHTRGLCGLGVTDGLIACWDAGSNASCPGTATWLDIVGSLKGTLTNMGVGGDAFSSINGGHLSFSGSDDYVNIPDDSAIHPGTGDFSVCMWVKPTTTTSTGSMRVATTQHKGSWNTYPGWNIRVKGDNGSPAKWVVHNWGVGSGLSNTCKYTGTTKYVYDAWYLFSMCWDTTTDNAVTAFVDDAEDGNSAVGGSGVVDVTNSLPLQLGATTYFNGSDTGSADLVFEGSIATLQLYNKELVLADIKKLYNAGKHRFGK